MEVVVVVIIGLAVDLERVIQPVGFETCAVGRQPFWLVRQSGGWLCRGARAAQREVESTGFCTAIVACVKKHVVGQVVFEFDLARSELVFAAQVLSGIEHRIASCEIRTDVLNIVVVFLIIGVAQPHDRGPLRREVPLDLAESRIRIGVEGGKALEIGRSAKRGLENLVARVHVRMHIQVVQAACQPPRVKVSVGAQFFRDALEFGVVVGIEERDRQCGVVQ